MRPHQDANDIIAGLRLLKSRMQDGKAMAPPEPRSEEQRDFGIGAQILRDLRVSKLKVLSNAPKNRIGLEGYGLEIVEFVSL